MRPEFISPMLAQPGPLPAGAGWAAELKWDGMRTLTAVTVAGGVRTWSRNGNESSVSWPELAGLGAAGSPLAGRSAVLDGEVVTFDPAGRPSFERLQRRMRLTDPARVAPLLTELPAVYLVFDLLLLDGSSLLECGYDERRSALAALDLAGPAWQVPESHPDPVALLELATSRGLEGVVCKRRASPYRPGRRSPEWTKTKIAHHQEVVIGGWKAGLGSRVGELGSLVIGVPDAAGALRYAGRVGTGLDRASRVELRELLGPIVRPEPPFLNAPGRPERVGVTWVEPVLVGEVAFTEWTAEGRLRHPSWRGLRRDKDARSVGRE